jgi:hypothetical protein
MTAPQPVGYVWLIFDFAKKVVAVYPTQEAAREFTYRLRRPGYTIERWEVPGLE